MAITRVLLAALLLAVPLAVQAQPCAGFGDVNSTDPNCPAVEWIKNRGVTQGCAVGAYCPGSNVTRIQMALFMSRLGEGLEPEYLHTANIDTPGTVNAEGVVCETPPLTAGLYTRTATPAGAMLYHAGPGTNDVATRLMYRHPPNTQWFEWGGSIARASSLSGQYVTQAPTAGPLFLQVGVVYAFGIKVIGNGSLAVSVAGCELTVRVESRTS